MSQALAPTQSPPQRRSVIGGMLAFMLLLGLLSPTAALADTPQAEPTIQYWCEHVVVQDGHHTVLNVRVSPTSDSGLRYQLPLGSEVMGEVTNVVDDYMNMNYSLGKSQWGHTAMLERTDEPCERRVIPPS